MIMKDYWLILKLKIYLVVFLPDRVKVPSSVSTFHFPPPEYVTLVAPGKVS